MSQISIINSLIVPEGLEDEVIEIREQYVEYFKTKPGFVSSTFYRSVNTENKFNFINMVVWDSYDAYLAVVNGSDREVDKTNKDGMKVIGNGFPDKVVVNPGQYEVIG